jgi:hypothetical protein
MKHTHVIIMYYPCINSNEVVKTSKLHGCQFSPEGSLGVGISPRNGETKF